MDVQTWRCGMCSSESSIGWYSHFLALCTISATTCPMVFLLCASCIARTVNNNLMAFSQTTPCSEWRCQKYLCSSFLIPILTCGFGSATRRVTCPTCQWRLTSIGTSSKTASKSTTSCPTKVSMLKLALLRRLLYWANGLFYCDAKWEFEAQCQILVKLACWDAYPVRRPSLLYKNLAPSCELSRVLTPIFFHFLLQQFLILPTKTSGLKRGRSWPNDSVKISVENLYTWAVLLTAILPCATWFCKKSSKSCWNFKRRIQTCFNEVYTNALIIW